MEGPTDASPKPDSEREKCAFDEMVGEAKLNSEVSIVVVPLRLAGLLRRIRLAMVSFSVGCDRSAPSTRRLRMVSSLRQALWMEGDTLVFPRLILAPWRGDGSRCIKSMAAASSTCVSERSTRRTFSMRGNLCANHFTAS